MSTGRTIYLRDGIFYITFSCYKWIPLFEITDGYDIVYKWFQYLVSKGHQVAGFVIMPNHVHVLIALRDSNSTVNKIVSNGKRFMAYEIIRRLRNIHRHDILEKLEHDLTKRESSKGQRHRVYEYGFDVKICENDWFIEQKLNYIHANPCSKRWKLADNPNEYRHSSLRFYENYDGEHNHILTPYTALFED